jgi:hypothetical protein
MRVRSLSQTEMYGAWKTFQTRGGHRSAAQRSRLDNLPDGRSVLQWSRKTACYAVSSVCADHEEICALLSDDLLQSGPQFTLPNDEFVLNASKSPGLNQRVLQIRGLARYCLFTGSNCTRTCHSQTQGGHHVRQQNFDS